MMSAQLVAVFLCSFFSLLLARHVARKTGLVDRPNHRKRHRGAVPLVGGISVYAGVCLLPLFIPELIPHFLIYLLCAGLLVLVGALDDRFDISIGIRATAQAVVAIIMMALAGLMLLRLGYILGPGWDIGLGVMRYPMTLLVVWTAINAFNMVDGIDGLLGGLSGVLFVGLGVLFYLHGSNALAFWSFAMIAAILPYSLLNLECLGRRYKVFMGDAGSTLMGFTAIWLLLQGSQGPESAIRPVTALWVIAIPLMDMVAIVYRRLHNGSNLFSPDRQHIHHLLMRAGLTSRQACLLITLAAALLAGVGITGEWLAVPEYIMFVLFLLVFGGYGYGIKRAWRVARVVRRIQRYWRNHRYC